MEAFIRFIADGLLIAIVATAGLVGTYYIVRTRQIAKSAPYAVMAALTALLLAKIVSLIYQPSGARPYVEQGVSAGAAFIDNPGFPSDHALLASVIVLMIYMLTPYRRLSYILAVLVLIMSYGRVIALVHTPLDIVGGVAAAAIGGLWYLHYKKHK